MIKLLDSDNSYLHLDSLVLFSRVGLDHGVLNDCVYHTCKI